VEKNSPSLGRTALYTKSAKISKLPKYLITQVPRNQPYPFAPRCPADSLTHTHTPSPSSLPASPIQPSLGKTVGVPNLTNRMEESDFLSAPFSYPPPHTPVSPSLSRSSCASSGRPAPAATAPAARPRSFGRCGCCVLPGGVLVEGRGGGWVGRGLGGLEAPSPFTPKALTQ
jgi:hypothetical protein